MAKPGDFAGGRQRLTKTQREAVERIVLNCKLSGLSLGDTQRAIHEKLNIMLSENWITHIRMKFKADCKQQLKRLSLDRYEFISHYMERISEIKNLQTKFWEEWYKIEDSYKRIEVMREAREQTVLLLDLLEHLPLLTQHQPFDTTQAQGSQTTQPEEQPKPEPEQPVF